MNLSTLSILGGHRAAGNRSQLLTSREEIHHHILQMADLLSTGILRSLPECFRAPNGAFSWPSGS